MPLVRFLLVVGGVLLAPLFVSDAYAPKSPVVSGADTTAATGNPAPRIRSDRKWPERVVFDASLRTIIPALTAKTEVIVPVVDALETVPAPDSFAQSTNQKTPEPKLHRKRKIAKSRVAAGMVLVAQQPRFGFFANDTW